MTDTTLEADESRKAPSGFRVEQAMSIWGSVRARLLNEDESLEYDEAAITELLGEAEGNVKDILARVGRAAKHAEAMAESAKEMKSKLAAREKRYNDRNETLRGVAMAMMEALGTRKQEWPDMTISITNGRQGVVITDLDKVPDIYVEVKTERIPDKRTIASALNAKLDVPGAELRNAMDYVTIRTS